MCILGGRSMGKLASSYSGRFAVLKSITVDREREWHCILFVIHYRSVENIQHYYYYSWTGYSMHPEASMHSAAKYSNAWSKSPDWLQILFNLLCTWFTRNHFLGYTILTISMYALFPHYVLAHLHIVHDFADAFAEQNSTAKYVARLSMTLRILIWLNVPSSANSRLSRQTPVSISVSMTIWISTEYTLPCIVTPVSAVYCQSKSRGRIRSRGSGWNIRHPDLARCGLASEVFIRGWLSLSTARPPV